MGGIGVLEFLEEHLSNVLRVGKPGDGGRGQLRPDAQPPCTMLTVDSTRREFVTHLPRYSARVAAGRFSR